MARFKIIVDYDDEDMDWFPIHHTVFRNVPLSQLRRLMNIILTK